MAVTRSTWTNPSVVLLLCVTTAVTENTTSTSIFDIKRAAATVSTSVVVTSDDADSEKYSPQLELNFTSNTTGYIQTPGWDGDRKYPMLMNSWAGVEVPGQHSVMVSFVSVNLQFYRYELCKPQLSARDVVWVYAGGKTSGDLFWKSCIRSPVPEPTLLNVSSLHVHFTSEEAKARFRGTGFRLLFSFHRQDEQLTQLDGGLWNCSVPVWERFKQHFPCNLQQECVNWEDEANCPYKDDKKCGQGHISLGGGCYFYVRSREQITWTEASVSCLLRDAALASLNTPEEWHDVMKLLQNYSEDEVYIGLRSASPGMPTMYRNTFQWSDGTVAYYVHAIGYGDKPYCAYFTEKVYRRKDLEVDSCDRKDAAQHYLCETDKFPVDKVGWKTGGTTARLTQNSVVWFSNSSFSFVTCPSGHVTYEFLACDAKSACWSRGNTPANGCRAPLFTCSNGHEHVTYTFVCDFRPDCSDASDEKFCVFAPCRKAEFPCSNRR
ncbi:hypothetical protein BaRGS_00025776, partial [Batillaria attramentaria]